MLIPTVYIQQQCSVRVRTRLIFLATAQRVLHEITLLYIRLLRSI